MIKSLFNKYYRAIILQQEDKVQKLKQIFIKCTKGNNKAQARWQKNIANKKVSIYNTEKKKVFTIKQEKFEKNPDRYIKYAEKFLPEEDDEELNDDDVDKVVGKAKEKIQKIKKEQPKDAKEQLTAVYREVKTASPEAAKEIKSTVKDALTVAREKSTKSTTLSGITQASLVQAAGQLTKAAMKKEENDCSKYLEKNKDNDTLKAVYKRFEKIKNSKLRYSNNLYKHHKRFIQMELIKIKDTKEGKEILKIAQKLIVA